MPIDEKGRLYLSVSQAQLPYTKQEVFQVTEPDGKITQAWRNIEIIPDSIPMNDYELLDWQITQIVQFIDRKEIFLPIEGTQGFKKSTVLMLSRYLVDVSKHYCNHCSPSKMTCRIKKMPSGLYRRHFSFQTNGDITTTFFLSNALIASDCYHLIEEKAITPQEAKRLITSGQAYAELGLRRELGLPNI
jgi:hypothetical protein